MKHTDHTETYEALVKYLRWEAKEKCIRLKITYVRAKVGHLKPHLSTPYYYLRSQNSQIILIVESTSSTLPMFLWRTLSKIVISYSLWAISFSNSYDTYPGKFFLAGVWPTPNKADSNRLGDLCATIIPQGLRYTDLLAEWEVEVWKMTWRLRSNIKAGGFFHRPSRVSTLE